MHSERILNSEDAAGDESYLCCRVGEMDMHVVQILLFHPPSEHHGLDEVKNREEKPFHIPASEPESKAQTTQVGNRSRCQDEPMCSQRTGNTSRFNVVGGRHFLAFLFRQLGCRPSA